MISVAFAVPGSLDKPTGGYRYDRRVIHELRALGHNVEIVTLPDRFPDPTAEDLAITEATLAAVATDQPLIIDALAYSAMPDVIARLAGSHMLVALVHHPLALETGLSAERAEWLREAERSALVHARAIIVTSPATSEILQSDYGVASSKITVACPGVDPVIPPDTRLDKENGPFKFLSVGSLIPRKGHLDLIKAFAAIRDLDWCAEIVGDPTLDPDHARDIRAAIDRSSLADRITLTGALDEADLTSRYMTADCFVLATQYEGYGMAFAEAFSFGLPVIGTSGASEVIGDGGLMIDPGDVIALVAALKAVHSNKIVRNDLLTKSRARSYHLPRWGDTAEKISTILGKLS